MSEYDEKATTWDEDPDRIKRAEVMAGRLASAVNLAVIKTALEYGSGAGLMNFALKEDIWEITLIKEIHSVIFRETLIRKLPLVT